MNIFSAFTELTGRYIGTNSTSQSNPGILGNKSSVNSESTNSAKIALSEVEPGSTIALEHYDAQYFHTLSKMVDDRAINPSKPPSISKDKIIIAISATQMAELSPIPTQSRKYSVKEVYDLQGLSKLKYRTGEAGMIILELKSGKKLLYQMKDPALCVDTIKKNMLKLGHVGNTSKAKALGLKELFTALECLEKFREIEDKFIAEPNIELALQAMDILKLATEKLSEANDSSFQNVVDTLKQFLMRSEVNKLLSSIACSSTGRQSSTETGFQNEPIQENKRERVPSASSSPKKLTNPLDKSLLTPLNVPSSSSSTPQEIAERQITTKLSFAVRFDDVNEDDYNNNDTEQDLFSHLSAEHLKDNELLSPPTLSISPGEDQELSSILDTLGQELEDILASFDESGMD